MRKIYSSTGVYYARRRVIVGAAASVAATGLGIVEPLRSDAAARLPIEGALPSLDGATAWLNSTPLTAADLRGNVVLVNFWTLTCINWLRTSPYVEAWAARYQEQGLRVIGVHTPEFTFEQDIDNIRRAAKDLNLEYPIAVDSRYAIWRAFDNHYWPALYFVDAQGRIRHRQFGEGEYEQSEDVIRQLLTEAGRTNFGRSPASLESSGVQTAADWTNLKSPETPRADHGSDVQADGLGTVQDGRLYQLVRQAGAIGDRTFEIEFLDPGVRAYAFTFG